jgi:CRP-like cAMP-binding protein
MDPAVAKKIEDFFGGYKSRHYAKGQVLIHAQDNPEAIFHLLEGRVKKYDISYRGDEVVLNVFSPPAFFPMSYAINRSPNEYFYEAETDVRLQMAPPDDVVAFVKANPDVLYDLMARVYRGTDGMLRRMAHLMASGAKSRVMYELLIEGRRFGVPRGEATAVNLSESDLGARSGLARETVSREMQKLKKAGLLELEGREIIIRDLARLAELLGREL